MERLKTIVPYVVFLMVSLGMLQLYVKFFTHPAGVPQLGSHIWQDLGQKVVFMCFAYPLAVLMAKITGQLKPKALFAMLIVIYIPIWLYIMYILDQLAAPAGGETFFSIDGILSYEYWPYAFAELLNFTVLPVLFLVLLNHLTRRSSRTRKRAA